MLVSPNSGQMPCFAMTITVSRTKRRKTKEGSQDFAHLSWLLFEKDACFVLKSLCTLSENRNKSQKQTSE